MTIRNAFSVMLLCALAGCQDSQPDGPQSAAQLPPQLSPQQRAQSLIDAAQQRYVESQQRGFAWVNTKRALTEAQTAFDEGEFGQAGESASLAVQLADASIEQAQSEAVAWKQRFPFNQ